MKKALQFIPLLFFFSFYAVKAQEITKKDTLNGTELTVSMDTKINTDLEKMEDNCTRIASNKSNNNNDTNNNSTNSSTKVLVANRALTTEEICRKNPRIQGFKIQLAIVKSNNEANEVKAYFRSKFPYIKAQTDASLRPNYKVLAGSYFSKQSAASDLANVRKFFKSAVLVSYYIFCAEGK